MEVFDRNSNILVNSIGKNKATDPVDIYPLITLAALDIICGMNKTKLSDYISRNIPLIS